MSFKIVVSTIAIIEKNPGMIHEKILHHSGFFSEFDDSIIVSVWDFREQLGTKRHYSLFYHFPYGMQDAKCRKDWQKICKDELPKY